MDVSGYSPRTLLAATSTFVLVSLKSEDTEYFTEILAFSLF